jgi:seryl-tRNA synthetase
VEEKFSSLLYVIPNIPLEDVPEGRSENDNKVIEIHGKPTEFKFEIKNHIALAKGDIDLDRAVKISGSRFVILKNDLVLLEFAIINMVLDLLRKNGFEPIIPPTLIKSEIMKKTGHADTKEELEERYYLQKDELFLVGTSEQSIVPIHADEILENVPKRYVGFSSCFREEAGSYGKDTKGMFRLHQFDKIEMISFTAKQDSQEELNILIGLEKKILEMLEIPYRVVHLCAGDMGKPSASTFDMEGWFPSQGKYRELMSASNCTDYQARRLNIKYKTTEKAEFVHILNATAVAIQRTLIALLENHQQKDGKVLVPKALRKCLGKKYILG